MPTTILENVSYIVCDAMLWGVLM